MRKILLTLGAVFAIVTTNADAALIAYWDFNDSNLIVDSGAGTLSSGTFVASNVAYFGGTTVNSTSGTSAGQALALQNGTGATNNGAYIQFNINLTGFAGPAVTYAVQRTSTGFNSQVWSYSTGGGYTTFATVDSISTSFSAKTVDFSSVTALSNASNVSFRVAFSGGSSSSSAGNNRLDNIQFNSVTAVPEPHEYALGIGALVMLVAFVRRRRVGCVTEFSNHQQGRPAGYVLRVFRFMRGDDAF